MRYQFARGSIARRRNVGTSSSPLREGWPVSGGLTVLRMATASLKSARVVFFSSIDLFRGQRARQIQHQHARERPGEDRKQLERPCALRMGWHSRLIANNVTLVHPPLSPPYSADAWLPAVGRIPLAQVAALSDSELENPLARLLAQVDRPLTTVAGSSGS
jgi:hypothetical protein